MPIVVIKYVPILDEDVDANSVNERSDPYAVLRAKCELLAEFLGCTEDVAERVILNRVCDTSTGW